MSPDANLEGLMASRQDDDALAPRVAIKDHDLDNILEQAAEANELEEVVDQRPPDNIPPLPEPVRRTLSWWAIALRLQSIFLLVAILGATRLGLNGVRVLNGAQSSLIFLLLGSLGLMAASAAATRMDPGSTIRFNPRTVLAGSTVAFVAVFAVLFQDYRMDRFISEGLDCLATGLVHDIPAGLLLWLVIRKGVVRDPIAVGLAAGTLAGMAGFGMLEMHCPILKSMHLMVWHIAVIPLSGLAGYVVGRRIQDLGAKRKLAEFIQ